jgi:two-component system nitrate/nitrite response regulator NarL
MDELRVLIISGDPLTRAGLAALLSEFGCTVVDQLAVDSDLPTRSAVYHPDVALWDLGWDSAMDPELSLEALTELADSALPVVALLPDGTDAVKIWAAGASGLLGRDADPDALLAALKAAARRLLVLDRAFAAAVSPFGDPTREAFSEELTPRELEVLQLLADGLTNKAIALQLGISEHTVKFHVNAILGKLEARSRTEAVVRATRLGLLFL